MLSTLACVTGHGLFSTLAYVTGHGLLSPPLHVTGHVAPPLEVVPRSQLLGASVEKKRTIRLSTLGSSFSKRNYSYELRFRIQNVSFVKRPKMMLYCTKKKSNKSKIDSPYEEKRVENPNPKISISGIRWTLYIISLCIWDQVTQLFVNQGINLPHVSQKYQLLSPETFVRVAPHLINEEGCRDRAPQS